MSNWDIPGMVWLPSDWTTTVDWDMYLHLPPAQAPEVDPLHRWATDGGPAGE